MGRSPSTVWSTADGFWPTELNPRFGAGIMTIARGAGIPMVLVNDLIVGGHDIGRTAVELEADVVAHGDERRGGGTWKGGFDLGVELDAEPLQYRDGAWSWSDSDGAVDGRVTTGAGFVALPVRPDVNTGRSVDRTASSCVLGLRRRRTRHRHRRPLSRPGLSAA